MNKHLQALLTFIQESPQLTPEEKTALNTTIKEVDKELEIALFKLDRTEKVKRTTAILLEETIEELEQKRKAIEETNEALIKSLAELKATQAQLIQSEKMASLGELTAGIAHEIQNPLNFVNNFSEVSHELIDEMCQELAMGNKQQAIDIAEDVKQNLEKILIHGKRADGIVKGMLMHSRSNAGIKEPTDINTLADEYLRLAYHGMRAKDKSFNVTIKTDFDESIGKIDVVPQDIGRVLLNLITNAFHALSAKASAHQTPYPLKGGDEFVPTVSITTKKLLPLPGGRGSEETNGFIEISVTDNGPGIPDAIKDKIFQPFFTTKPTGQGTGLGLSLSYDIVKAHGGEIKVETKENEGTTFTIQIPL
jgi:signal transduction histidine kinase